MTPVEDLRETLSSHPRHRLAFALDFPDWGAAAPVAARLAGQVGFLKIGLELFVSQGPSVVAQAGELAPVFLDLKLHDIPETVERAVGSAAATGARLLTLHASCGQAALARAVRRAAGTALVPVAVTVLTSMSAEDLRQQGLPSPSEHALKLADLAWEAGVRAFVTSPHEVRALRGRFPGALLITPGIRQGAAPAGDDQRRTASAREAIEAGADLLVVGRPLREAADPPAAARALADEITAGLGGRS